MSHLLGHDGNRLYVSYSDGSVRAIGIGKEAPPAVTLPARGRSGETLLRRPAAAVATDATIYIVDSELSCVAMFSTDGKYKGSFGRKGSEAGELRAPQGIAFRDGIVYVADSGNSRVQMYGDNGVFLDTLEIDRSPANKAARDKKLPYQLNRPVAITLDPGGRAIYVLDSESALFVSSTSIKAYAPDGAFLGQLPKHGNPIAVSAAPDALYAADRDSGTIQKYDIGGAAAGVFVPGSEGPARFGSMNGLATDGERVFVGDRAHGVILEFRTNAAPSPSALGPQQAARPFVRWIDSIPARAGKLAWDGKDTLYAVDPDQGAIIRIRNGAADGELKLKDNEIFPVAAAVDQGGALWVLDKHGARAVKVDPAGRTLATLGAPGSRDGQLDHPADIAISANGVIYIADAGNHRVQAFGDDGAFRRTIGAGGKLRKPEALALDPQGNLYVLDTGRALVSVYSAAGQAMAEFGQDKTGAILNDPRGLMATRDEVMVVEPGRVKVYSHDGRYLRAFGAAGHGNGEFTDAAAIVAKDATSFFVADPGNRRVQAFTALQKPAPPAQVTAQGAPRAVALRWEASPLPYVAQYRIYRSRDAGSGFVQIGASKLNLFSDDNLPPGETYYYRVAAVSDAGYEGLASPPASAVSQKYSPARPDSIQAAATPTEVQLSWHPLDVRYIGAYLIYLKAGDSYAKLGETVMPEFTVDGLTPGTDYTFYVSARSVDGIESDKTFVHATTAPATPAPPANRKK